MNRVNLSELLKKSHNDAEQPLALFAMLNLGFIESLSSGAMSSADAIRLFYDASNCLFVRKHLGDPKADEIMSRGVQLQDLFDTLPAREAQQEFQRELTAMRSLSLQLLQEHELVA